VSGSWSPGGLARKLSAHREGVTFIGFAARRQRLEADDGIVRDIAAELRSFSRRVREVLILPCVWILSEPSEY
jgi:hypothetical protein